ncbi:MAG: ABC transporter permease [Candidatus Leucobacter sulfamidivorax]|nr:ABC transporter permease [Candidatus Leucobacter sulfamidivorax]
MSAAASPAAQATQATQPAQAAPAVAEAPAVPAARIPPHAGVGPVRASRIFIGRSMRHGLRDGESLVLAIALPILLMLMFTIVFGGAIDPSGHYVDFVLPGTVILCSGFGASSVAVSVNRDLTGGAMRRFRSLPIPAATCLIGHAAASILRNLLATALVVAVGLALGFRPVAGPAEWLAAILLVLAWIAAVTAIFAAIGLISTSPEAANGYGFAVLFLPYLSSAFVPIETMPAWLQPIAAGQPVTPLTDALRALLLGGDPGAQPLIALAWCLGIVLVAAAVIAWRFPKLR